MKVSEFEDKLATVSDAKLLQMLSAGRRDGPEIAVKLILAEGHRRGLEDLEQDSGKATKSYPNQVDREADAGEAGNSHGDGSASPEGAGLDDVDAPAGSANWLAEETSSGMPAALKVALYIAALGGLVFGALKFIHRG